ncbi:MAG TPA: Lrp/AsnC family transcriptional regulator [Novosphingobium sp.]|nr:Lrp/AsnC family transcriptional regulator [Novosphingobium sp.]
MDIDSRDRKILDLLQRDADMPVFRIAELVALSPSACSRRIAALREAGYIRRTVAVLNRDKLDLPTTVFVILRTQHSEAWLERFRTVVAGIPEILECHRLTGNFDYIIKIVIRNIAEYDRVYKELIAGITLSDVSGYISMETIKEEWSMPVLAR